MEPEAILRRGALAPPSGGILNHFLHNPRLLHHRNYSPFERRFVPSSDCNKAARTPATDGKFNKTSNIFSGFSFLFHLFHTKVHTYFFHYYRGGGPRDFPFGDHPYITYSLAGRDQVGGSEKGNVCFQNFINVYQRRGEGLFKNA